MNKDLFIKIYVCIITIIAVIAIIIGVTRIADSDMFSFMGSGKPIESASNVYECSDFTDITVNTNVSDITLKRGDSYQVSYDCSSTRVKSLAPKVSEANGTLHVTQSLGRGNNFGFNNDKKCDITITIPADAELKNIKISSDVGEIDLDSITAKTCDLSSDVGEITIKDSSITEITLSSDVGDILVKDTVADSVKADSGVGDITLTNVYDSEGKNPRTDIDTGVGDTKINQ